MVAPIFLAGALVAAGPDRILEEVRRPGASVVVLNVWATWCLPCREEFPDLVRLEKEYRGKGLRLVLVSADFPDAVEGARAFLTEHGVAFDTFIKGGDVRDQDFIDGLDPRERIGSGLLFVPRAIYDNDATSLVPFVVPGETGGPGTNVVPVKVERGSRL